MNYKDKEKVLQEYKSCKLCEEILYINEDFSEETIEIRKALFKQEKELRKKGKSVKVIHNWLISLNGRQNPSEFDAGNEEQKASYIFLIKYSLKQILSFIKILRALKWLQTILSSILNNFF